MKEKLILALDVETKEKAQSLVRELKNFIKIFKIGPQLFTRYGPEIIEIIQKEGGKVFYDAKFYDISSIIEKTGEIVGEMGIDMFTVHTLGGSQMMRKVVDSSKKKNKKIKVLGVTILTSLNSFILKKELGIEKDLKDEVIHLSTLAKEAGLDGVVASAHEAEKLRQIFGKNFLLVIPGIRPSSGKKNEQKRVMTPKGAIQKGADFLVIGRPITKAKNPLKATYKIIEEMGGEKD